MALTIADSPARSNDMPAGVTVQPRRFTFDDLDAVPQYWFSGNPVLTHMDNAFSILIPPGEKFFVRSVQAYADELPDEEARDLLRAFSEQEELHSAAHDEVNTSFAKWGVDIEREQRYADEVFRKLSRRLPRAWQLGITAFSEHLTATSAHLLFVEPAFEEWLDPQMLAFWRWHAAEELEHKAVAFDLFHRLAGGYLLRVASAIAALVFLAGPFIRITNRMQRDDPHRPTRAERRAANKAHLKLLGTQLRMVAAYFSPRFHPWKLDDTPSLERWYAEDAEDATGAA